MSAAEGIALVIGSALLVFWIAFNAPKPPRPPVLNVRPPWL